MKHIKSERLKKLEAEFSDLQQWLKLGLVPKKDIDKHKEEIQGLQLKIEEEKERLQFLKESGEIEEFVAPKRPAGRSAYQDMPSIPDIDVTETAGALTDTNFDTESEAMDNDTTGYDDKDESKHNDSVEESEEDEDESYFSDRNRWRRGGIIDPDADEW